MATQEPGQQPSLTALPRLEDIPRKDDGYDPDGVREAFEAFRRHSAQLQAQLRVLQAASRSGQTVEPTGHAVRMDALHLIRSAAEFADTLEADAQRASEAQLAKTEEEVRRRRREQSRHQATELTNAARAEVEQTLEWARAQAGAILARAQQGAEQLLTAAGLGPDAIGEVSDAILSAAKASAEASRGRGSAQQPAAP